MHNTPTEESSSNFQMALWAYVLVLFSTSGSIWDTNCTLPLGERYLIATRLSFNAGEYSNGLDALGVQTVIDGYTISSELLMVVAVPISF